MKPNLRVAHLAAWLIVRHDRAIARTPSTVMLCRGRFHYTTPAERLITVRVLFRHTSAWTTLGRNRRAGGQFKSMAYRALAD